MEKPLGRYFQVWFPYYQAAKCNQKTPIPVSLRWQVRSEKTKDRKASTLITATTNVHLPKPVSTDLTIKSDLVFTNPIGKDGCEAGRCNKTSTPYGIFIVIPSLEGWPTKAKEALSPHEVRLTPLDTNPVFQCLEENTSETTLRNYFETTSETTSKLISKLLQKLLCVKSSRLPRW